MGAVMDALSDASMRMIMVRFAATAFVIIAVTLSVELFGPLIGGVLAGLPITVGPGFFFLADLAGPAFISRAASYAVLSLCATQGFLLAYILIANRWRPWTALGGALASWIGAAFLIHWLPANLFASAALFLVVTGACALAGQRVLPSAAAPTGKTSHGSLLLRGALAGLLVAAVTTASHWLGAAVSGLLLSFPIGYSVISITLHQQMGRVTAMRTLYSAIYGTISLGVFCTALALTILHQRPYPALGIAFAASLSITLGLVAWRRLQAPAVVVHR